MGDILKDSRFTKYLSDPRYRQIPKHERKVKIDKRFQSMFSDEKFKVKYTVDKRGRPVNETSTENLRKYYDVEESDSSNESDEGDAYKSTDDPKEDSTPGRFVRRIPSDDEDEKKLNDRAEFNNDKLICGQLDKKTKRRLQDLDIDYARGEGVLLSESSSDDETSDEEVESELEHEWGELDADAETTDESTRRIAVCNLDWDNIKANDIMVLLNSFLPPSGVITKVSIFPSEYGIKRMQDEEVRGPKELTEEKVGDQDHESSGNEEGSSYHMEKLRRYQLNRLKYFYAVVECDSVVTADKLYSECDGMEYESSATRLDMRFIPDDVTFDQEPREICTKLPDLAKYRPRLFTTTALQQAKVELTWDSTNPNRTETIKNALDGKIDDLDLKDYLASSSSEDEDVGEKDFEISESDKDPIQKYKMLLEDIEKKDEKKHNKDMEMEITWGLGIKDRAEELVKKKISEENENMTPFEKMLKKRKDKKKQRKLKNKSKDTASNSESDGSSDEIPSDVDMNDSYFAEEFNKPEFKRGKAKLKKKSINDNDDEQHEDEVKKQAELELLLDEDDGKAHFSLKKIQESESTKKAKRKRKLKEKIIEKKQALPDFEVNVNDNRFSALYNSHHFNIDPTDPNFKKTKNMEKLIQEKLRRRPADTAAEIHMKPKKSKEDAELNFLVNNIKRKTKLVMPK